MADKLDFSYSDHIHGSWKEEKIPVAQSGKDSKEEGDEAYH